MFLLSTARRPRRAHEWTNDLAVTFVVTLAATCSVTLAARASKMSRKAAYMLKARDPSFAAAWAKAVQGYKVDEVEEPPVSPPQGNRSPSRRDFPRAFTDLMAALRDSAVLVPRSAAQ